MVEYLYSQMQTALLISDPNPGDEGVVLKRARGQFTCCPSYLALHPQGLFAMSVQMNVRVSISVTIFYVSASRELTPDASAQ